MKQLLLLAAACCIITVSKAQFKNGSTMIGGNLGYNYSDESRNDTLSPKYSSNGFSFGVTYAKCYKENTFWGVSTSFSYSDNKIDYPNSINNSSSTSRSFYLGIFTRKYYPIISNLYFFGQAGLGYSFNDYNANTNPSSKGYSISINAYPGISYKATNKIYLETTLYNLFNIGYSHSESNSSNITNNQNRFSATIQLPTQILQNLNVGMTIIIGK